MAMCGEAVVPISPFVARSALVAFAAIGAGVATNLLYLQDGARGPASGRTAAQHNTLQSDAERLRKMALEAAGLPDPSQGEPSRATPALPAAGPAVRIGSFAPSAGSIGLSAMPGLDAGEARRATVRSIQGELHRRGYAPGTADGSVGLVTRAAVMAYEHDQGLPLTADPSPEILAHLRHGTSAPGAAIGLDGLPTPPAGHAEQVIRSVQTSLSRLGYLGRVTDSATPEQTLRAIREFEMDNGMVPSGRISAPLVVKLAKQLKAPRPD
jgi:peptidoglycan hydrolase-like protein with peptidoglycan-binding domain